MGFGVDASSAFGDSRFGEFACDGACFVCFQMYNNITV